MSLRLDRAISILRPALRALEQGMIGRFWPEKVGKPDRPADADALPAQTTLIVSPFDAGTGHPGGTGVIARQ